MTFQLKKISKSVFAKKNLIFSQNIFSRDFFSFRKKICFEKKLPISIRNCLKIPKIALRKSCDKFKAVKNKKSEFFYKFYQILVMCQVFLPLSEWSFDKAHPNPANVRFLSHIEANLSTDSVINVIVSGTRRIETLVAPGGSDSSS